MPHNLCTRETGDRDGARDSDSLISESLRESSTNLTDYAKVENFILARMADGTLTVSRALV